MSKPLLIIGNKNYSSWSLRPWLALKVAGVDFDEKLVPLFEDDWAERKAELPSGTVPVLEHDGMVIWETLAILEYVAETWPDANLWPSDKAARAMARTVSSEMHAGFTAVRGNMPMNIRSIDPGRGRGRDADERAAVERDVRRIEHIWTECRETYGHGRGFSVWRIFQRRRHVRAHRVALYDLWREGECYGPSLYERYPSVAGDA